MATCTRFEDIDAWQKASSLTARVHVLTAKGSDSRDYAFVWQIRTGAISVMSNIAEGFEREGTKAIVNFLSLAKGSAAEVRTLLYAALDIGYCDRAKFGELSFSATEIGRMIGGLMRYLCQSEMRSRKFMADPPKPNQQ